MDPRRPGTPLRRHRERAGLTRRALGDLAGISAELIKFAEGGYVPSAASRTKLADALGVPPAALFPPDEPGRDAR